MKATGIVRRIDDLGRVVIPKEIRRTMRIREGDPSQITLARWERFCAAMDDLAKRNGVGVVHSNRNYNRAYQRRFYQAEKALELVEIQRVPVPFRITFWDILRLFSLTVFRKYTIINKNICYSV